jgi:GxxExxY protein
MNIKAICRDIFKIAGSVYKELGGGFNETVNQNALAIEFREKGIHYLKEVNIEIFYKGHAIGNDRPDFILLPNQKKSWQLDEPIVLETKVKAAIKDDSRQQLKCYFKSFPHNKNAILRKINKGILLNFLNTEKIGKEEEKQDKISLEFWSYSKGKIKRKLSLPERD